MMFKHSQKIKDIAKLLSSVVLTCAGLIFSYTEMSLYRKETLIMEQQVQPHFVVDYDYSDGFSRKKANKKIIIYNKGDNFYNLTIDYVTFLEINREKNRYYMPIKYFYKEIINSFSNDDLIATIDGENNNYKLYQLWRAYKTNLRFNKKRGNLVDLSFIRIEYQDINGNYHIKYFDAQGGSLLNQNLGENIFNKYEMAQSSNKILDFMELDIDHIEKYIDGNKAIVDLFVIKENER